MPEQNEFPTADIVAALTGQPMPPNWRNGMEIVYAYFIGLKLSEYQELRKKLGCPYNTKLKKVSLETEIRPILSKSFPEIIKIIEAEKFELTLNSKKIFSLPFIEVFHWLFLLELNQDEKNYKAGIRNSGKNKYDDLRKEVLTIRAEEYAKLLGEKIAVDKLPAMTAAIFIREVKAKQYDEIILEKINEKCKKITSKNRPQQ